ncbi:MAG TPA: SDR family oxidoreductase [Nitrososphaeraceae archaeon]|nr:SDR family oxidoreductase [Nitrososphaeraceae archaeon]
MLSLKVKVVVVTGSTRVIDFAISKEFAENNDATVIVCSRSKQSAVKSAEEIKGKTFAAEIDVTNRSSIKRFLQQIVSDHERIDILINNAGYSFDRKIWYKKFHEVTDDEVDRIIEVDLKGSVRLSMAVLHSMLQNNPEEGVIINISSTPAIAGHIGGASYTIAKAANIALTKCIVLEYGDKNIRAYTLALDNIATLAKYYSMNENDRNKAAEEPSMRRWAGLKRSPRLMHVLQVIIFLLLQVIPL